MTLRLTFVIIVFFIAIDVPGQANGDPELPPDYKSDGCTLFPDGNYRDCCVEHDKDYFRGGSCKERRESDKRLYRCVRNKKGWKNKLIAPIMWLGVRVAGVPFLPTPFRWGFGKKRMKRIESRDPLTENGGVPAEDEPSDKPVPKLPSPTPDSPPVQNN